MTQIKLRGSQRIFYNLALAFFASRPTIPHEVKEIRSRIRGGRIDLVVGAGTPQEVFASLDDVHIVIGTQHDHEDFEDFGRRLSDAELAQEAFDYFVERLSEAGLYRESV